MAKEDKKTVEEVVRVVSSRTDVEDKVSRVVEKHSEPTFPAPETIELIEPFVDPFEPPSWCDRHLYEYGWLDPRDDIGWERGLKKDHWHIVTRNNHAKYDNVDFRDAHGAVERMGMILVYRPWALAERLRFLAVADHMRASESYKEPKEERYTERRLKVGLEARDEKITEVYAHEEPGEEGLIVSKK